MTDYEALTRITCGETYRCGDNIPSGVLSEQDAKALLELGCIKQGGVETPPAAALEPEAKKPKVDKAKTGLIDTPEGILAYVNNADQAELEVIKGIGTATAKAILSHGKKFRSIYELKELVPNVNWDFIDAA